MNILKKIIEDKKIQIENDKVNCSISDLKNKIKKKNFSFKKSLDLFKAKNKIAIIAEIKKASPSKGVLLEKFDHIKIAEEYCKSDAACLSVLTENKYFLGNKSHLKEIKNKYNIPVLCKDFFIDVYQVYEAASLNADCILLLLNSLDDQNIGRLLAVSKECGMDTILETHNEEEMKRAIKFDGVIIGINNRNLENFEISLNTTIDLFNKFNLKNKSVICESGINVREDIDFIKNKTGINNFLVGESLIKSKFISRKLSKLNS